MRSGIDGLHQEPGAAAGRRRRPRFFEQVLAQGGRRAAVGRHFTVDGTLIEASASLKSFRAKASPAPTDAAIRRSTSMASDGATRRSLHDRSGAPPVPQGSPARPSYSRAVC